jgi:hypothetical protein
MVVLTDLSARGSCLRRVPLFATLLLSLELATKTLSFHSIHQDNIKTTMLELHRLRVYRTSSFAVLSHCNTASLFPESLS